MKTLIMLAVVLAGMSASAESPYNLTVSVVNFHQERWLHMYRAEVKVDGTLYMIVGVSNSKIALEEGHSYPALRADRHGRDNFRIVTPDGNSHWFEIESVSK